ncbi:MAG TPA: queuosine precursor transporter [Bacteroidia bacterium]|nr:queuosine precursor transporter [Bacteroidia bacterium]
MDLKSRKDIVFLVLAGFFITNAIVAELIGGKLVQFFGLFTQSIGIILWPVIFLLTDLINEYYGKDGVRKLTYITVGLISFTFILLSVALKIPATSFSPVSDDNFRTVFGQSQWIIVGSIVAFLFSQLIDVYVFWAFKKVTGDKHIWLRATGSTMVSQLVDTFVVQFIAFVLPGKWAFSDFLTNASWGYAFKLLVALALIPLIYLGHFIVGKYLRKDKFSIKKIQH